MTTGVESAGGLVALLAVTVAVATIVARRERWSPLTAGLWVWVAVVLLLLLNPAHLFPVSDRALVIAGVGIVALAAPTLIPRSSPTVDLPPVRPPVLFARLLILAGGCIVGVTVGYLAFRSGIESATGLGFGQLSLTEVRDAQTGAARGGGLAALLVALQPLLGCLGVYGAVRHSRNWIVLSVIAVGFSLQSPARLVTLTLLVQMGVMYLYLPGRRQISIGSTRQRIVGTVLALVAMLSLFNYIGGQLGKNTLLANNVAGYTWPSWTLSPLLNYTGGLPALSQSLRLGVDPFAGRTSVYSLLRAGHAVFPTVQTPDSLAGFVEVPLGFNVYTGFGQAYWDFSWAGVVILAGLLGWFAVVAHRRARAGFPEWAWVAASLTALLITLPQAYRLFYLDVDFALVAGFIAFRWLRSGARNLSESRGARSHGCSAPTASRPVRATGGRSTAGTPARRAGH